MIGMVTIGKKREDDGLVGALSACHARIRDFVELAIAVAEAPVLEDWEVRDAVTRIHRYFSTALPLHVADEEELIAPHLAGTSTAVDAAISTMTAEHAVHRGAIASFVAACHTIARMPARRRSLLPHALLLRASFVVHLASEERVIFPVLAALPAETQARVLRAMRDRRQTPPER